ncbi:MAG: HAD-IIIC family phosphatase [Hungatella sp.]|nr:HAD-IIIC family phosphatase [Hungatella sp.]
MFTFKELKKHSKTIVPGKEYRLAVLGNCATQFLATSIKGFARKENINLEIFDTDYNQIDSQLIDKCSEVYAFDPDFILLYISTDKIYEEFMDMELIERSAFAVKYMEKITYYWNLICKNSHARILQMNFSEIDDKIIGNYSCKTNISFTFQIRELNYLLQHSMMERKEVLPIDLLSIQINLGIKKFYDPALYYNAKMAISIQTLPYVAKAVIDVVKATLGKLKKCVVLDLDNTLWGGVIGDDGIGNIEIGELGRGHAFTDFQRWLKQLKDRGILLAVCSKNNEDTAKEPFINHEEMILKLTDISIFVANWNDKASNIKYIQTALNLGMDSLVFLDDNTFERNLVRSIIPEIEVPELPEDPAQYLSFIQECNLFEAASYSDEDQNRTKQYQSEFERNKLQQEFESIDDYLNSLNMVAEVQPFDPVRYSRIAQLTQRSNQFNLRTIRYTEDEIERIANDSNYVTLYYTLRDKFGDHGLISVVILKKQSADVLFIDTWLMSCRVLKRGMEEFIINKLVGVAEGMGYSEILAEYIPTPKNSMVKDIYTTMGFEMMKENHYKLEVATYKEKCTYIKEEQKND